MTRTSKIIGAACVLILLISVWILRGQWAADNERLKQQLDMQGQVIEKAHQDTLAAQADLKVAMNALEEVKSRVQSPTQVIREIPRYIDTPLPKPIMENRPEPTKDNPHPEPTSATIPAEDLKPLFDALVDAKETAAKLIAANATIASQEVQIKALEKERDEYKRVAKGGSIWQRTGRAMKWVGIGIGIGIGISHGAI